MVVQVARASVGTIAELEAEGRLFGVAAGRRIGVIKLGDDIVAFEDKCPHAGGPVCAGKIFRRVEAALDGDQVVERFSDSELVLTCPWHGWEFDARTGRSHADPRYRLRSVKVAIEGDEVVVDG
jgi:nitrite reductase/ring-hydroxylating ferredoxin subunit